MVSDAHFTFISALLQQRSGITLTPDKNYLLDSRLQPVAREHGFASLDEMLGKMQMGLDEKIIHEVVQAMTTNETMFFRDNKPYERFSQSILPYLKEHFPMRKHIRIWSAACSTGQEAYTLAICLQEEMSKHPGYRFEIIGSDLCEEAVAKAKRGEYTQFEVQRGMPIQLLVKYFKQVEGNNWQVNDTLKKMVRFETHNLLESARRFGEFDIIFCRNVLIYFNREIKSKVVTNLVDVARAPGFTVLGSAESLIGISDALVPMPDVAGVHMLKK